MDATDVEIIRNIRREFGKRPIDSSALNIEVKLGHVSLAGTVKQMRDQPGVDVQWEVDSAVKNVQRERIVKDVANLIRCVVKAEEKKHDDGGRGRMRHG